MNKPKLLFVCSQNRWRSLTAEIIFRQDNRFEVRSAGTSRGARHVISQKDIDWADKIICMEERHKELIKHIFKNQKLPPIIVWDIESRLTYMDPELIEILKERIEEVV
ncbi:MAG: protein tyrosine phosphatase [Candidatus Pacebacteria bacterium]|nr:protein tyrosine phosphatase [Candidatus Paceibacterota bacterium]